MSNPCPPSIPTFRDLEFKRVGNRPILLDIHLPAKKPASGALPVVVWVHGGGWANGSKIDPPIIPLEYGFALVSIDYRLSTEAIWPAQIDDCKDAIRFVRKNAAKYGLDPNRMGAFGGSAGGHLVAQLATMQGASRDEQDTFWHVRSAASCCGPTDLTAYHGEKFLSRFHILYDVTCQLLGGPVEQKLDLARDASPIHYVTPHCPPLMIVHGDKDTIVPVEDAPLLYDALKKAGAKDVVLDIHPGGEHALLWYRDLRERAMRFFERTLG